MTACAPDDEPTPHLTPEWRAEAVFRLFRGLKNSSLESGTSLKDCMVPWEVVDPKTGKIRLEKNIYQKVRIMGKNYPAHTAVLMVIHDRHPIRNAGKEKNEVGMHLCNNPACRNPLHLRFGTCQEDSNYKVKCGRAASGKQNGHYTKPERTQRGDSHYNCRMKGLNRSIAIQLLKKYGHLRGAVDEIAAYLGTTTNTIQAIKRKGLHLLPGVEDTEIELQIVPWRRSGSAIERKKKDYSEMIVEIRRRFHTTPVVERSGMLDAMAAEFGYHPTYIRKILKREVRPDIAPDIPIPTEWGIGRRKSFKNRSRQEDSK